METNYIDPVWKIHPSQIEWHFYIGESTRQLWDTFTTVQKQAIYNDAMQLSRDRMAEHYKHG